MTTALNRRDFLKGLAAAGVAASTLPLWGRASAYADTGPSTTADRFLLLIFLQGGNDGVNTVIPAGDTAYPRLRGALALKPEQVLDLGIGMGLHPSLPFLHQQWSAGRMAILHSVGYPKPDLSHFRSTEYWETASPERRWLSGWVGRYLDATEGQRFGPIRAVGVGGEQPRVLTGDSVSPVALRSLSTFSFADGGTSDIAARRRAYEAFSKTVPVDASMRSRVVAAQRRTVSAIGPVGNAARSAPGTTEAGATAAHLFAAGVGAEVGFISLGGFDTHTDQLAPHAALLSSLDATVNGFFTTAGQLGIADRSTVLVFSEFGRRAMVNYSNGTDHGAAGPAFVIGPRVIGGAYGTRPNLNRLVDGNIPMSIDFRRVYASLLEQVLKVPSAPVLGEQFATIPLIRS